ncbi:hypothetical protein NQK81_35100 [Amycolatopsis roodepoortensis]|uniref:hypothetical protein n=1 Tax=Amycolatopsis roodepoortensis TaxID=700274 RepID=UPI00214CDBB2|nr:hypothetical protein [Amycolatopsis roodepoortensis]UUV29953.1 hypothetical protein NQK81_35100 [Amycolatopsis roodepoortensis]
MTTPPDRPDNSADAEPADQPEPRPRWVLAAAAVAITLLVVFVVLHLAGLNIGGHR